MHPPQNFLPVIRGIRRRTAVPGAGRRAKITRQVGNDRCTTNLRSRHNRPLIARRPWRQRVGSFATPVATWLYRAGRLVPHAGARLGRVNAALDLGLTGGGGLLQPLIERHDFLVQRGVLPAEAAHLGLAT